ncbi:unnamed protein product [Linum trigynum]|uniref:UBX domain-containing protein n=1 Tax=Linum trigynum TaxID=586398 RepID=A0AAV2G2Y8_9ROSI
MGESCIAELAYKGSTSEAILEAKAQKKLFVVYISGKDPVSVELEKSIWTDSKVADTLSKYCVLLHVLEGSNDAVNFSAIFPQKSVPAIAVIGFNGIQLWQSDGCVSAEVLVSSLEKAYLSLHIQETTASVFTAALTNTKSVPTTPGSSDIVSGDLESSSDTVLSSPADKKVQSSEVEQPSASGTKDDNQFNEHKSKDDENASSEPCNVNKSKRAKDEQSHSRPLSKNADPPSNPSAANLETADNVGAEKIHVIQEVSIDNAPDRPPSINPFTKDAQDKKSAPLNEKEIDVIDKGSKINASNDVYLNIKLLYGTSIQEKFLVSNTLRMVKEYVDSNQENGNASYDLAIPYPRKIFGEQDLGRSLSELGLLNRQALIVVPHQKSASYFQGDSSSSPAQSTVDTSSSIASPVGYFGYIRKVFSFINPLSYVGGSSSATSGQAGSSMWQYSPNQSLPNSSGRPGPAGANPPDQHDSAATASDVRSRRLAMFGSGSNVHTLRRDEDDDRPNGRNAFWNGNSTQFGGGDSNNDGRP